MAKSKISREEVKKIAKLADLKLAENEVGKFQKQLSDVLNYVAILDKLDTTRVKSTSQVTGLKNITRADETEPSLSQEEALSNTKDKYNGYFKVPIVITRNPPQNAGEDEVISEQ